VRVDGCSSDVAVHPLADEIGQFPTAWIETSGSYRKTIRPGSGQSLEAFDFVHEFHGKAGTGFVVLIIEVSRFGVSPPVEVELKLFDDSVF